jgi:hypothetical protein
MKDSTYETLRIIAMLIAPIAAFVAVLCNAWNIPYAQPIAMTLTGLDALMGAVVEILRNKYKLEHPEIYQEEEGE